MKLLRLATVWCGGEQDDLLAGLPRNVTDQVVALLLAGRRTRGPGARVSFVHNHQFWTLLDEYVAARIGFDEVNADDLVGVVIIHAGVTLDLPVKARLGVGPDDNGLQVELGSDFLLPLFAQVWQADNGEAFYFTPLQQLLDNQQRLDGFAHPHIV